MPPASRRSRFPGLRLAQRAAFTTNGGLSAMYSPPAETGCLSSDWVERYRADEPRIVYVVLSYATPIAWIRDDGEVVIPACRYSLTTTRHQRLCRIWL
ncbi:hypothetical protein [Nonomuraea sp. B19D2]|uniref:hypothetical protein n=1 Tax=Nonomuraea sp. B19D2 TaxID=3159561 RepID=UPI0032DB97F2